MKYRLPFAVLATVLVVAALGAAAGATPARQSGGATSLGKPSTAVSVQPTTAATSTLATGLSMPMFMVWQGTWSSTKQYKLRDAVHYNGSAYIALHGSLNDPPPSANWSLLAQGMPVDVFEPATSAAEGFESATFPPAGWTTGGNTSWTRSTTTVHGGGGAAESGTIANSQTSYLDIDRTYAHAGYVDFWWKVGSEPNFDFLLFCLDNDACTRFTGSTRKISGAVDWTKVSAAVGPGAHSFRWVYAKDSSDSTLPDKGWIDDVNFVDGGNLAVAGNITAAHRISGDEARFSGDLGLGVTNPTQLLHMNVTAGHGEGMAIDSALGGHSPAIYLNHTGPAGRNFRIASYGDNTNPGSFRIRDDTSGFDRLIIDSVGKLTATANVDVQGNETVSGNLGVGMAPTRRVDVNGVLGVTDGASVRKAGVVTEADSTLIDLGVNDGPLNRFGGTYTTADQGGLFRIDTRPGQPLFSFMGRKATGVTDPVPVGSITSGGTVRYEVGTNQKFSLGGNGTFEIDAPGTTAGRFFVAGNGNVGIGHNNPPNILSVQQGSATDPIADHWTEWSSRRFKRDIHQLRNPLQTLMRLRGVTFRWKKTGKEDFGMIAEEVAGVLPQLASRGSNGEIEGLDYARLVSVLVEGTKAQQVQIRRQNKRIASLETRIARLEALAKRR